jgi:hypothetical protein
MRRVAGVARLDVDNESEACALGLSFDGKEAFRRAMTPLDVRDNGKGGL